MLKMKILLFELNSFHFEVLPGFAYYLIRLGYEVDCLMQKDDGLGDPFSKCPLLKKKIRFYYFQKDEKFKAFEELQRQHAYDLLFANSFDYLEKDSWISIFRKLPSLDKSRLCIVGCLHWPATFAEDIKNGTIPADRTVVLSKNDDCDNSFSEVNANYFCDDTLKKPKNQMIRIVSIGRSTDRRALWRAAEAARKRIKQPVYLVCIGKKRSLRSRILFYGLSVIDKLFHVKTYPSVGNILPFFVKHFRKQALREVLSPSYQDMFQEIEAADFLDGSILLGLKADFSSNRTSGAKQLSLGFLKPCIIEKCVADHYGFTDRNAVIYEEGKMDEAVIRAASMTEKEYREMVSELEKLRDEIRDRSENNLRHIISNLESAK